MGFCGSGPTIVIDGEPVDFIQTSLAVKRSSIVEFEEDPTAKYSHLYADEPVMYAGNTNIGYQAPADLPDDQLDPTIKDDLLNPKAMETPSTDTVQIGGEIDYNMKLSKHITLRQLTLTPVCERNAYVRDQSGVSKQQIVNNLKALSIHIIDPIIEQFGMPTITSAFRHGGSSRSQHCKGQAVDLQWNGEPSSAMLAKALWIKQNLPYDQLILEKGKKYWIHVSFNRDGNRSNSNRAKFGTMTGGGNYTWGKLFVT